MRNFESLVELVLRSWSTIPSRLQVLRVEVQNSWTFAWMNMGIILHVGLHGGVTRVAHAHTAWCLMKLYPGLLNQAGTMLHKFPCPPA